MNPLPSIHCPLCNHPNQRIDSLYLKCSHCNQYFQSRYSNIMPTQNRPDLFHILNLHSNNHQLVQKTHQPYPNIFESIKIPELVTLFLKSIKDEYFLFEEKEIQDLIHPHSTETNERQACFARCLTSEKEKVDEYKVTECRWVIGNEDFHGAAINYRLSMEKTPPPPPFPSVVQKTIVFIPTTIALKIIQKILSGTSVNILLPFSRSSSL